MLWLLCLFALLASIIAVVIAVYAVMTIDDLVSDNLNPIDTCHILNRWVPVDVGLQLFISVLFLLFGHFYLFLWNVPATAFGIYQYVSRGAMSGLDIYDPTKILRRDQITFINRCNYAKVVYYAIGIMIYLVVMLVDLLSK